MHSIPYHKLRFLVADDFSSFRNTIGSMLTSLGVVSVDMAANAKEVLELCQLHYYDVILCDYNLGSGRTGQHALEELRYRGLIDRKQVFILISAEASRNIVMAAYDCAPDDYLMKPITARMLQQRIDRLLRQSQVMAPVYRALADHDFESAEDKLVEMALAEDRYSSFAQKLLGELFLEQGQLNKAEKLYTHALEIRPLDWARLGLARVKQLRGELDVAGEWLERIVDEAPLYLPAYDALAENWEKKGQKHQVQHTVQKAVDISPMSILRQKRLADVAEDNSDVETAIRALRRTLKLGELSCHARAEDHFRFARAVTLGLEREMDLDRNAGNEAIIALNEAKQRYELSESQLAQCDLLGCRLHTLAGNHQAAEGLFQAASERFANTPLDIDAELERVSTLLVLDKQAEAERLLEELKVRFADDEEALEKLDAFLNEPVSEANRNLVAEINREGIKLYEKGAFDDALASFERARKLFPKHVGIQLNIAQAFIGKLRRDSSDVTARENCFLTLNYVDTLIDENDPQYRRFKQLRNMAKQTRDAG